MGIEPTCPAWKAGVLPLNYTRIKNVINLSAQNRNRTSDTRIFSPLLYQLSYLGIPRDTITATAQDIFYNQMLWIVKKIFFFSNFNVAVWTHNLRNNYIIGFRITGDGQAFTVFTKILYGQFYFTDISVCSFQLQNPWGIRYIP